MQEAPLPLWLWGIVICVLATALTALGLVLIKYSHTLNAQISKDEAKTVYYKQPWWLAGFAIFAVAQVINLISMSMAPQVMLSCLGATALIFNAVFAWLILDEALHLFEIGLVSGMLFSVIMVISTTPIINARPTAGTVLDEIVGPLFEISFLMLGAVIIAALALLQLTVHESAMARRMPDLTPVTWTLCSAAASGFTVNLFKASSEFLMAWPETRPLTHWKCYVVLVSACGFGALQVHCLNCALNLGSAMMVVPLYFSLALLAQLGISEAIAVDIPQTPLQSVIWISGIVSILVFIFVFVRTKIAYEEQPNAELDEVLDRAFQSWPSSPTKTGESTGLLPASPEDKMEKLRQRWANTADHEANMGMSPSSARSLTALDRGMSMSSYDCDAYQDSFMGDERSYTVSVIGLGIA